MHNLHLFDIILLKNLLDFIFHSFSIKNRNIKYQGVIILISIHSWVGILFL